MIADATDWPIPRPSLRARLYCATKFADKTVPFDDGHLELAYNKSSAPSQRRRIRRLEGGQHIDVNVYVVGRQAWCPPFPEGHPIRLTIDTATCHGGGGGPSTERPLPLDVLDVAEAKLLDPPQRPIVPGLETWTLTTRQPQGTATITGLLTDLALLAAVAGWQPPRALLDHRHAGAAGHRPGPQPRRAPIRPLGWVLIALGVVIAGAAIAALAFTNGGGSGRGLGGVGGLAGLLILTGWGLRRRAGRPDDAPRSKEHDDLPKL